MKYLSHLRRSLSARKFPRGSGRDFALGRLGAAWRGNLSFAGQRARQSESCWGASDAADWPPNTPHARRRRSAAGTGLDTSQMVWAGRFRVGGEWRFRIRGLRLVKLRSRPHGLSRYKHPHRASRWDSGPHAQSAAQDATSKPGGRSYQAGPACLAG